MKTAFAKLMPLIIGLLLVILIIGAGVYFVMSLESLPEQKKVVQQITVIKPPPPPEEPPPPPEEVEEEIEEPVEEDVPDEPEPVPDAGADEPAGEELGLDADGSAGGDSFGLKAKKGGRGFLGGGNAYGHYIKGEINKRIVQEDSLRYLDYVAVITIEVNEDGSFKRVSVDIQEGSDSAGAALEEFLMAMARVNKSKPLEEKETRFKFRISSTI